MVTSCPLVQGKATLNSRSGFHSTDSYGGVLTALCPQGHGMHSASAENNGADAIWRENTHSRRLDDRASFVLRTKTFSFLHVSFTFRTFHGWIVTTNNCGRRTNPITRVRPTSTVFVPLLKQPYQERTSSLSTILNR